MKFLNLTEKTFDDSLLKTEYKQARQIGRVRIGTTVLFSNDKLKTFYIAYEDIYRVFRRIKAVPARICCGKGEIRLEFLVLCNKKDEIIEIDLPDERASTAIIEEIQKRNQDVKVGKK